MLFYEQQLVINFNPFKCQPHKFTCINLVFSCINYLQIFKDYATEGGTEVRPANFWYSCATKYFLSAHPSSGLRLLIDNNDPLPKNIFCFANDQFILKI